MPPSTGCVSRCSGQPGVAIFPGDFIGNVSRHIYVPLRREKRTRRSRHFRISPTRSRPLNNDIDPARKNCHTPGLGEHRDHVASLGSFDREAQRRPGVISCETSSPPCVGSVNTASYERVRRFSKRLDGGLRGGGDGFGGLFVGVVAGAYQRAGFDDGKSEVKPH